MYSPRRACTRAWSRAALAASSVANPPTHLGLLTPVSGFLTRITYDQVFPRFMTPSRSFGVLLRLPLRRPGWSTCAAVVVSGMTRRFVQRGGWGGTPHG